MTPEAASALPLADLIDSALVLDVAVPGLGRTVWAGRLARVEPPRGVEVAFWWADELVEAVIALAAGAPAAPAQLGLDGRPARPALSVLAALDAIKRSFGSGPLELSPAARATVFGPAPQRSRAEVEALWAGWGEPERAGYRRRAAWARERVERGEAGRLQVARYAAWRVEVERERAAA